MNKISVDKDYLAMRTGNAGELYRIIGPICIGSNSVDHPLRSGMETMLTILCIKGDSFTCRSSYHESFLLLAEAADKGGWCMATESLRDAYITNLSAKGNTSSILYRALTKWKGGADAMAGIVLLHEKMKALLFIRNSGAQYKNLRNELENDCTKGIDSYPHTVTDANHRLEYWKPLEVPIKTTGSTHLATIDGATKQKDDGKQLPSSYRKICFKCDKEGHLAKDCPNDKKKDGSPLNSSKEIDKKFDKIMNRPTKEPEPEERETTARRNREPVPLCLLEAK